MTSKEIPVIDFSTAGLDVPDDLLTGENLRTSGTAIIDAFSSIGFCYLKNHGVQETFLDECRAISKQFFLLPYSFKDKYRRLREDENYLGWVGFEDEATNPKRPGDLKEAFNYSPNGSWGDWPEDVLPQYRKMCEEFFNIGKKLALRVMRAIAVAMNLPEDNDLMKYHSLVGRPGNHTEMRTLYYPPLDSTKVFKENQVRLGEHFDFGSLTVLFQDDIGGLEVCTREGEYVPATPIPGTALVNIGEIMQRWTADRLIATKHRVMLPDSDNQQNVDTKRGRQSLVLFLCPNDESQITCIDGSDKYPAVPFLEHCTELMEQTYSMSR